MDAVLVRFPPVSRSVPMMTSRSTRCSGRPMKLGDGVNRSGAQSRRDRPTAVRLPAPWRR